MAKVKDPAKVAQAETPEVKNDVETPAEAPVEVPEAPEAEANEEQTDETNKEAGSEKAEKVDMVENEADMSDEVKRLLRIFSNHEVLAIDGKGGVYTDAQHFNGKTAILYKNPYFK